MKKMQKVFALVIAATSLFSFTGFNLQDSEVCAEEPNTYLVNNGATEYKIVTPVDPSEQLEFAAQEMQAFMKEITGAEMEIIDDSQISGGNYQGKYISIDRTEIYTASGYTAALNDLGTDGYIIKTYGNSIVICGGSEMGSSYGVYGLLDEYFDLEIYTYDCWTYEAKDTVKLETLDIVDMPDIPQRCVGRYDTWYSGVEKLTRMRVTYAEKSMLWLGHSFYHILPIDAYYGDHPEWFGGKGAGMLSWQLCLTNEEMRAQFVENLKVYIANTPDRDYVAVGQNDGGGYCRCQKCSEKYETYGSISGLYLEFTNYVAEQIVDWMNEIDVERAARLQFYLFAYDFSAAAPVNEAGVPQIMANENVGVFMAPIGQHSSHAYTDQVTNAFSAAMFENWGKITNNFYIWSYSTHFGNYMMPHNSFSSMQENITSYVKLGAKFVFDQGPGGTKLSNFEALKTYLLSTLMWDSEQDFHALVANFCNAYYGEDAGPWMYKYWDLMRTHLTSLEASKSEYAYCAGQLATNLSALNFPKGLIDYMNGYFEEALKILKDKVESDSKYQIYYDRVEFEYMEILYLYCELHEPRLASSQYGEFVQLFKEIANKNSIVKLNESGGITVDSSVNKWTS